MLRTPAIGTLRQTQWRRFEPCSGRLRGSRSFQFSRTERVRLEFPAAVDTKPGGGRLLDKAGEPLAVPVTMGERTDAQTGQRWVTADITLAALAAGDYVVEVTLGATDVQHKVMTAIRVTR